MKNIRLYNIDGYETLNFKFGDPEIYYDEDHDWEIIETSNKKFVLSGTSAVIYDDTISNNPIPLNVPDLWKSKINEAFANNRKVLLVFTKSQIPVIMFHGGDLKLRRDGECAFFTMDQKTICLYKMNYLIFTKTNST